MRRHLPVILRAVGISLGVWFLLVLALLAL